MTAATTPPAASAPLVSARGIGVRRSERWIIRHVDVRVESGALVYVIGANGAGKSTCARAVLGLTAIDEGTVERAPGLKAGYVPQRLAIGPTLPLTLRRLMRLTGRYPRREIDAALAAVGLKRLGNPPISTLSGGEFQRLLLARALIDRPDLLVLDEPAQGVDVSGADVFYELIDEVRRTLGCGILIISHDIELAARSADDVVVLEHFKVAKNLDCVIRYSYKMLWSMTVGVRDGASSFPRPAATDRVGGGKRIIVSRGGGTFRGQRVERDQVAPALAADRGLRAGQAGRRAQAQARRP